MSTAVILDDLQERHDAFRKKYAMEYDDIEHCYNFTQFARFMLTYPGEVDFVSLDHDLGDWASGKGVVFGTGMDAVRLLVELMVSGKAVVRRVNIHSHNYAMQATMADVLAKHGFLTSTVHFTSD